MPEWITGRNPVYEVLRAGRRNFDQLQIVKGIKRSKRIADILTVAEKYDVPISHVTRAELDRHDSGHQGVALRVGAYPYSSLIEMLEVAEKREQSPFLLILDTLQDPQNLGTLLRTAESLGVHGILLPLRHTATVTPAVVNTSSGASEHLLITQTNLVQAISTLKENDVWVVGMDANTESKPVEEINLDGPLALVVGSEGRGLRRLVRESCDFLIRLPMLGQVASLNAAVAGSITLYLAAKARGGID